VPSLRGPKGLGEGERNGGGSHLTRVLWRKTALGLASEQATKWARHDLSWPASRRGGQPIARFSGHRHAGRSIEMTRELGSAMQPSRRASIATAPAFTKCPLTLVVSPTSIVY
jgi:hypothetical protein